MLRGDRVALRPANGRDADRVYEILSSPGVSEWWPAGSVAQCREAIENPDVETFIIERREEPVGLIQYWEEPDDDYRHAGIDIAIHSRWQGQGFGPDAVRTLARYIFDELGHHRITIDPAAGNRRAIRCYEKVGFKRVGVMREYERGANGKWHDGLLMDLLVSDLK